LQGFFKNYTPKIEKHIDPGVQVRAINDKAWQDALQKLANAATGSSGIPSRPKNGK
jgi:hypothetical protein